MGTESLLECKVLAAKKRSLGLRAERRALVEALVVLYQGRRALVAVQERDIVSLHVFLRRCVGVSNGRRKSGQTSHRTAACGMTDAGIEGYCVSKGH